MKMQRHSIAAAILWVCVLVLGFHGLASAQEDKYVGASVGQSKAKDGCTGLDPSNGFVGSCKDTDTAFKVYGGAHFTRNWGAEIGYAYLGKTKADGIFLGTPLSAEVKVSGIYLDGTGTLPIGDKFSIFGKLGAFAWFLDSNASISGFGTGSDSANGVCLTYGIGVQFDITKSLGLRAEWEEFNKVGNNDTGKSDVSFGSVGIVYKF
jgi:OmpA-OmpF porin, OOP family